VRGVTEPLALEERIASLITDSIAPRLLPDLEVLSFRKTHMVAVQVYPGGVRPHYWSRRVRKRVPTFASARPIAGRTLH
jgi:ATP-dependent DNA helicase RecG